MNPRTLPVKRRPVSNGLFKRIHAVTRHRNQRVAATATADDLENQEHSTRISRGFTIIFMIHIVAIALYFIHLNFLNGHSVEPSAAASPTETTASPKPRIENPPLITPDDATCMVVAGDNYASIAAREGVDEAALRAANGNKSIAAGATFILPTKRIVAVESPVVVALRKQTSSDAERGLVEAVPFEAAETPQALPARPSAARDAVAPRALTKAPTKTTPKASTKVAPKEAPKTSPKATPVAAKRSYVVKPGDNLYRISKRYKIDQADLMRANGINDPGKLSTGATLVIPH
jgi:LysM repeat protein